MGSKAKHIPDFGKALALLCRSFPNKFPEIATKGCNLLKALQKLRAFYEKHKFQTGNMDCHGGYLTG
jgi:hypothetical protein